MEYKYDIPDSFYSLFRSPNRDTYIEALLIINEEYEYQSYFLSREACVRILSEYFSQKKMRMEREDNETESDMLETPANRILNWLLKSRWLKKLEDYYAQVTNIIIPDYAAIFIEAFEKLTGEGMDETEVYIQNIYAILFSLRNDPRANVRLLKTALVNTKKLNKSLQDMLHNMDKFFNSLLEKEFYGDLLKDHLEGYVEEIIRKKYHILKTSDNFYIYKSDIKQWIREMQNDYGWIQRLQDREEKTELSGLGGKNGQLQNSAVQGGSEEILEILDRIDHGFDDIERRIANMDKEHMKYVKATVVRLNYLLNQEGSMKGMIVQILNEISRRQQPEEDLARTAAQMNLSRFETLTEKSLYRRRAPRKNFIENLKPQEEREELSREDILKLNQIHHRYSRRQIEEFLEKHADLEGTIRITEETVQSDGDFEQLILAYDYAGKKNSRYQLLWPEKKTVEEASGQLLREDEAEPEMIDNGRYRYPKLTFIRKENG